MKRILTAIAVLLMACATVFAQGGYQVKGVVVDDMGPVIGAAVVQQGTTAEPPRASMATSSSPSRTRMQ